MKYALDALQDFIGYDLLKDNSVSRCESEKLARKRGISQDFYLQGEMCYTSLFMNIDASTMEKHIKLDWSMTTIYVPQQKWEGKRVIIFSFFSISLERKMECYELPCLLEQLFIFMAHY